MMLIVWMKYNIRSLKVSISWKARCKYFSQICLSNKILCFPIKPFQLDWSQRNLLMEIYPFINARLNIEPAQKIIGYPLNPLFWVWPAGDPVVWGKTWSPAWPVLLTVTSHVSPSVWSTRGVQPTMQTLTDNSGLACTTWKYIARVVNSDFRICCKHTTSCSPDMSVFIRHARVRFNKPDKKLQTDRLFINPDWLSMLEVNEFNTPQTPVFKVLNLLATWC